MSDIGKKDVVIMNMSRFIDWQHGIVNRNRFILEQLHKHPAISRVLCVDFVPFTMKQQVKQFFSRPKDLKLIKVTPLGRLYQHTKIDNVYVLQSFATLLGESRFVSQLEKIMQYLDMHDFIFWSYHPMFIKPFLAFRNHMLVFDAVDDWTTHASYGKYKERLQENYQIIDEVADYIFTVSKELKDLFPNNKDTYWVPNGVDIKHFQKTRERPDALKKFNAPLIGYIGTIQERVDFRLLYSIAQYHEDKEIIMLGPVWPTVKKEALELEKRCPNVHFLGRVNYQDSPAYLQHFDVCIIPHQYDTFIRSTNSMKLYEYLACDKPVVSTPGSGVELFSDIIYIADEYKVFNEKIETALREDANEKKEKRDVLLRECTWSKRTQKMFHLMFKEYGV